jgi:N-acetylneuraminate synthase/pseudaminic acid synthase
MHTKYYDQFLGMTAVNDIEKGTPLSWDLIR